MASGPCFIAGTLFFALNLEVKGWFNETRISVDFNKLRSPKWSMTT